MKPAFESGDIFRRHLAWIWHNPRFTVHHKKTLQALADCRTAALGGHIDACTECGLVRISYNSCRNRHCPKCQNTLREKWIMARESELLSTGYFHVVFTLPDHLNPYCLKYPRLLYNSLFAAAWQTVKTFAKDPKHLGAQTGMTAVLHTWGQNMSLHPHLHCIVPGGGLSRQGKWKTARSKGKFLFPVKAMSLVFRAKFVALLRKAIKQNRIDIPDTVFKALFRKKWVVYAKRPFLGPKQVIEYLGRYTHKAAISNHRLEQVKDGQVTFRYKDYRQAAKVKFMPLPEREFIRRFALHILPSGFRRIRHYGLLAPRWKAVNLSLARKALGISIPLNPIPADWKQICRTRLKFDPEICPCCKTKTMIFFAPIPRQRPPPLKNSVSALAESA